MRPDIQMADIRKHEKRWEEWHRNGYYAYSSLEQVIRMCEKYFDKMGGLGFDMTILDIGCGDGRYTNWFSNIVKQSHGIDISATAIRKCSENYAGRFKMYFHKVNGWDFDIFNDGKFDLIFSVITFQHIPKSAGRNYLKECRRVLKKGGHILIQFATASFRDGVDEEVQLERLNDPNIESGHISVNWSPEEIRDALNGMFDIIALDTYRGVNPRVPDDVWHWVLAKVKK